MTNAERAERIKSVFRTRTLEPRKPLAERTELPKPETPREPAIRSLSLRTLYERTRSLEASNRRP